MLLDSKSQAYLFASYRKVQTMIKQMLSAFFVYDNLFRQLLGL